MANRYARAQLPGPPDSTLAALLLDRITATCAGCQELDRLKHRLRDCATAERLAQVASMLQIDEVMPELVGLVSEAQKPKAHGRSSLHSLQGLSHFPVSH